MYNNTVIYFTMYLSVNVHVILLNVIFLCYFLYLLLFELGEEDMRILLQCF